MGDFIVLENVLEDNELGRFLIKVNTRARRLTFRTREDAVYVTVPPGTTMKEVKSAIEQLRPRLRIARKKRTRPLIDLNFRIDTEFFKLSLVSGQRERFLSRSEGLQVAARRTEVRSLAVCLDPTPASLAAALAQGAEMVLSHHPLTLKPTLK